MNAKELYNQAYSDRRAVASKHMSVEAFLAKYNETERHTVVSEKAVQSFVKARRYGTK